MPALSEPDFRLWRKGASAERDGGYGALRRGQAEDLRLYLYPQKPVGLGVALLRRIPPPRSLPWNDDHTAKVGVSKWNVMETGERLLLTLSIAPTK